jgi:hypothetical protein
MSSFEERLKQREQEVAFEERLSAKEAELEQPEDLKAQAFERALSTTFGDMVLGFPAALGKAPAAIAAGVQGIGGKLTGGDFDFSRRFQENIENAPFPASLAGNIPAPTVTDITAGFHSIPALLPGGETPQESFQRITEEEQAREMMLREAEPGAFRAGEVAADIAAIAGMRVPISRNILQLEKALMSSPRLITKRSLKRWLEGMLKSRATKKIARGALRALETGGEAAALEALKGEDPMQTAAWAAGLQVGSSIGNTALAGILGKGGLKEAGLNISLAALGTAALWQVGQDLVPGGEDSFIKSLELGYEKVALSMAFGMVLGAYGKRLREPSGSEFVENAPLLADALTTIPRGAGISMLEDLMDSTERERADQLMVMDNLIKNVDAFKGNELQMLENAHEKGTFKEAVGVMMRRDDFRERMSGPPPQTTAPTLQDPFAMTNRMIQQGIK